MKIKILYFIYFLFLGLGQLIPALENQSEKVQKGK